MRLYKTKTHVRSCKGCEFAVWQGYIPGKVSENVIGERQCKTVAIAGQTAA